MRVLVVARWYPAHDDPGRGSFVADLVAALRNEGIEIVVASWENAFIRGPRRVAHRWRQEVARQWSAAVARPDALNTPRAWGAQAPVARLPALRTAEPSVGDDIDAHAALLVPFGLSLAERWPFDVIHAHVGLPDGLAAAALARQVNVPLLVTEHDSSLRQRLLASTATRAAYRRLIHEADGVFAVSEHFRGLLCRLLELADDAIGVLPNLVPPLFFSQPLAQRRDPHELLFVGHRKETKGVPVLLHALAKALQSQPRLRLRLVGRSDTPATEARWHDLASSLGITQRVRFEEPLDRAGVARLMSRAGLLVHPSRYETFGIVVAEALACGLPVVSTLSGVEEILGPDGAFGEVAESETPEALAAAILRCLERRGDLDPSRLRAAASERYAADAVARRVIARYEQTLESRQRRIRPLARPHIASQSFEQETPPLLIGVVRPALNRRLEALAPDLLSRLTLLTDIAVAGEAALPTLGRVIEVDLEPDYRAGMAALGPTPARLTLRQRMLLMLRSPRTALARRRANRARADLRDRRAELRIATARAAVLDAWRSNGGGDSERRLQPLDADDVLAARLALDAGARLTPGSTRWIADRWNERAAIDAT